MDQNIADPNTRQPDAAVTFEESLQQLELMVRKLEEGDVGLTEALECYEQGIRQLKQCYQRLDEAEQRIELLTRLDTDGNATSEPFAEESMSLQQKADTRSRRRTRKPSQASKRLSDGSDMDDSPGLF